MSRHSDGASQAALASQHLRVWWTLTVIIASTTYLLLYLPAIDQKPWTWTSTVSLKNPPTKDSGTGLAVVDSIYVVSLRSRQDRRNEMDALARLLGLRWTYTDAVSANDSVVKATLQWVKQLRGQSLGSTAPSDIGSTKGVNFTWPPGIETLALSDEPLDTLNPIDLLDLDGGDYAFEEGSTDSVLPVATEDYKIAPIVTGLPDWMILTPSRVACWHSHLNEIKRIANGAKSSVTLVLEDDVDMEQDIDSQLNYLWNFLPPDWDIFFLGERPVYTPRVAILHVLIQVIAGPMNHTTLPFLSPHRSTIIHMPSTPMLRHPPKEAHRLSRASRTACTHPSPRNAPTPTSSPTQRSEAPPSSELPAFCVLPRDRPGYIVRKISKSDIKDDSRSVEGKLGHYKHGKGGHGGAARAGRMRVWKEELANGVLGGPGTVPSILQNHSSKESKMLRSLRLLTLFTSMPAFKQAPASASRIPTSGQAAMRSTVASFGARSFASKTDYTGNAVSRVSTSRIEAQILDPRHDAERISSNPIPPSQIEALHSHPKALAASKGKFKIAFISGPLEVDPAYFQAHYTTRILTAVRAGHYFVLGASRGVDTLALRYLLSCPLGEDTKFDSTRITVYLTQSEARNPRIRFSPTMKALERGGGKIIVSSVPPDKKAHRPTNMRTDPNSHLTQRDEAMTRASHYDILQYRTEEECRVLYGVKYRKRVSGTEKNELRRKSGMGLQ
ncbi:hypothetical protein NMY22_g13746 [Coprinellus aureogranulatus]|nr:hypothetical protein NMY22_g13746 [Coprinellus aureogranulatus]